MCRTVQKEKCECQIGAKVEYYWLYCVIIVGPATIYLGCFISSFFLLVAFKNEDKTPFSKKKARPKQCPIQVQLCVYTLAFPSIVIFVSVQPKFQFADICITYIMLLFQSMMILLCRLYQSYIIFTFAKLKAQGGHDSINKNSRNSSNIIKCYH